MASSERRLESRQSKASPYPPAEMPADAAAGVSVQDRRQVTEGGGQPDVGDVTDPDPVEPVEVHVLDEVRIDPEGMS